MCWWVTGDVGGVHSANTGERRDGVTVVDDGGATLGTGATLGSGTGIKHLGGGIRFVLGGGAGCKGLTGWAVVVSIVSARIVISIVISLRGKNVGAGELFFSVAVRFSMAAMTESSGVTVGLEIYLCL